MTLYLKYRPQTLDELIGQETIKKTIQTSFNSQKLSHAYLLVGPRGTGKTSTARILAKMVNCEEKNPPCNKCQTCLSITDGSNLDLIEIDAASNRGIDDIRSLRENIKLSPSSGKKKVYIIDEVHMLTSEAFNALLKTLEEPPEHALFILATTDHAKIPATILSRVQRLDFKLATISDLTEALQRIAKQENIEIEEDAIKLLAQKADGSFRDGVKLLDQVSGLPKVTLKDVESSLRSTKLDEVLLLLESLASQNAKESLSQISKQMASGIDMKELILSLMNTLRLLFLIKNDLGKDLVEKDTGSEIYENLVNLANKFSIKDIGNNLDILQSALEKLKFASILSLPLELAVVEMCNLPGAKIEEQLDTVAKPVGSLDPSFSRLFSGTPVENDLDLRSPAATAVAPVDIDSPELVILHEKWGFILETIRPFNFSLEALLRSVKILECSDGVVILEVPYSFHQRILETPKSRDLLESVISDVLGKSAKVSTVLGIRPMTTDDIANIEVAADDDVIRAASEIFEGSLVE